MEYPWTIETMLQVNVLTPDVKGKAFDPDWFLLRQRFEAVEFALCSLANEVEGWLGAYGEVIRPFTGNTNIAVMEDKLAKARAALAETLQQGGN